MEVTINGKQYIPAPAACDNPGLLELRFQCDDLRREVSIREYLCELLTTLWNEGEGFSGKRPFGNSGWYLDLFRPLIVAGAIAGELSEDGYVLTCDSDAGEVVIRGLIAEMCKAR
jgi:hypothetical protein